MVGRTDLLLGDVAQVVEDHQLLIGDAALTSGPGLLLVIEKFPRTNTLDVTQAVEETLASMAPGLSGVEIDTTIFRPADYIELASNNLSSVLLISAVLVALVLLAFFFHWRTALISLITIPVSLIGAVIVLYLRGATFNMMVLAGLTIALVVIIDDAIIDVENIARRLRHPRPDSSSSDQSSEALIIDAILEMRSSIGFSLLIILLTVSPIFFLPGLSGAFFQPLVLSYVLAVLASLAVALVLTPVLSVTLIAKASLGSNEPPLTRGLQNVYAGILSRTVQSPYVALILAAVFIIVGLALGPRLDVSLMPSLKQTNLLISWEAASGTSLPEMNRISNQISQGLQTIGGVINVGSHVGRAITGDAIVGINSGEHWITIDPQADYEATVATVGAVVDSFSGLTRQVQTYQPKRLEEALTRPDKDLIVRIYGPELNILREKGEEVVQILSGINGVEQAEIALQAQEPQIEIEVNLTKAEAHSIKPGDVRRQATTLLSGLNVGMLFEEQKVFDVVVWGVPEIRNDLTKINQIMLDTPAGQQVALHEVAQVRIVPAETTIRREAVSRFVDIGANISGRNFDDVAANIKERLQIVDFPFEFHAEVLTESVEQQAAQQRVVVITIVVLIGIFLLMQAAFDSWSLAVVIFVTLPMALVGGVLALFIGSEVFSIGSLFGFFGVLAIAVRNGIALISHFHHLERHEGEEFGPELVLRGARERLGPVLMTALATALALLPLVSVGAIAGNEIGYSIALVVFGGLITSALLNLFVVPALYLRFGSSPEMLLDAEAEPEKEFESTSPPQTVART